MTRINTNVSSLVAQNTLGRSNAALNQALTRLSTGLRINTGKDDPAGLIASENLRSDITSIQQGHQQHGPCQPGDRHGRLAPWAR